MRRVIGGGIGPCSVLEWRGLSPSPSALCAFGFSIVGYRPHRGYADDRVRLTGNHPTRPKLSLRWAMRLRCAPLEMQIRFALRNQAALDQLLADQQNPASPRYHQWLKTGEFLRRFGPSRSEVTGARGMAQERRLHHHESRARLSRVQGQRRAGAADLRGEDRALRRRQQYANTSDPVVPQRFADVVGAILGMDNMVRAVPVTHQPSAFAKRNQSAFGERQSRSQLAQAERDSRRLPASRRSATSSSAASRLSVRATCAPSMTRPSAPDTTAPATVSRSSASRTSSIRR